MLFHHMLEEEFLGFEAAFVGQSLPLAVLHRTLMDIRIALVSTPGCASILGNVDVVNVADMLYQMVFSAKATPRSRLFSRAPGQPAVPHLQSIPPMDSVHMAFQIAFAPKGAVCGRTALLGAGEWPGVAR